MGKKNNEEKLKQDVKEVFSFETPYILHYYRNGNDLVVNYTDNTIKTLPYSIENEIRTMNTMKEQAKELAKTIKSINERKSNQLFLGVCDAIIVTVNAIALVTPSIQESPIGIVGLVAGSGAGMYIATEHGKTSRQLSFAEKVQYYMNNERAISSALVKKYLEENKTGATVAEAHNITLDRLNNYSIDDFKGMVLNRKK